MASSGGLKAFPLRQDFAFNWIFLVTLIVCGILTLFFLFYFNRLFATLVSYGIRAWTWHRYRVYVDIQALQISLLGGRIFFKGLKYHGNNETILIQTGFITWCYWLRNVREVDLISNKNGKEKNTIDSGNKETTEDSSVNNAESGGLDGISKLPCRLNVSIHGAEWFVYNRSAAYDAIVAGLSQQIDIQGGENCETQSETPENKLRKRNLHSRILEKTSQSLPAIVQRLHRIHSSKAEAAHNDTRSSLQSHESVPPNEVRKSTVDNSLYLGLLPVHIDCQKAAVVLGNENTKSVLITKAERVSGEIDVARSQNPFDQYKQMFNFEFEHPIVQLKPNDDYKEDQAAAAVRIKRGTGEQKEPRKPRIYSHSYWHRQRKRAWYKLQYLIPKFQNSVESFSTTGHQHVEDDELPDPLRWQGLSRYLEEGEKDDRARWSAIEYATVTTIVDSPNATMSFYWDVAGVVPVAGKEAESVEEDQSPEWGLRLSIGGGVINYGPWADRQRAEIQRVFFPSLCKDSTPAKPPIPGQPRVPLEFKVYIEIENETTLRIPIREESKNWKWTKQADTMGAQDIRKKEAKVWRRKTEKSESIETRPFGWLDLKVGSNATVSYVMDMLAGDSGYRNNLHLDLPSVEVMTSVNHGLLMKSAGSTVSCDLSNPLRWNGPHTWSFDINSKDMELFILREHIYLFIDLVDDWVSGPPSDYLTFSPFTYIANLQLEDFKIYLNLNDANIINNPSDFEDNTFICIFGHDLAAEINVPLTLFRPQNTEVTFNVSAHDGGLKLHIPPWNTQATFLKTNEIATLRELRIDGKYQYCATTSVANTDTLILDIYGDSPTAQLYGFIIRYYLKIKDNYFGDDIRFKTLEEYQSTLRASKENGEHLRAQPPMKISNDLDVVLYVKADNTHAILPANLYSSIQHIDIEIANLAVDLRFTNYYMDLDVVFQTLAFSQGKETDGASTTSGGRSNTQLFIDGIKIYGNRLFGLPPAEPTYICSWDFTVGSVTGECTADFLNKLANGGKALAFSFDDDENALPLIDQVVLHDITFLRANVHSVRVWMHVEEAAFLLSTGAISVNFDDRAGTRFSSKITLQMPDLSVACVEADSALRHRSRPQHPVETHMLLQTTIHATVLQRKSQFTSERQLQQEHIRSHDQRTHRSEFLLMPETSNAQAYDAVNPPAMSVPPLPIPVTGIHFHNGNDNASSEPSSSSDKGIRRQNSFLSISSASKRSNKSVMRSRSLRKVAPSTTTDIRSQNLQPNQVYASAPRPRDVSVSTGRPSSFYSAVGDNRTLQTSNVSFSSSYMAPYFPLEDIQPDTRDLPSIPEADIKAQTKAKPDVDVADYVRGLDDETNYVNIIFDLPSGVRAMLSPCGVEAIAKALSAFQAIDPVDILDDLQIQSMNSVLDRSKQQQRSTMVTSYHLRTPGVSVRFLSSSTSKILGSNGGACDQYDLYVGKVVGSMRSTLVSNSHREISLPLETLTAHIDVKSFQLSATERCDALGEPQAAVCIHIQNINFWVAGGNENSLHLGFKDFQVTTASSKIEYLGTLIHRTRMISSNIAEAFSSRISQQKSRVQLLTYLVVMEGHGAPDPSFLTRPSYVLRSADNHLRTSDSWKIVTRMRHMYSNLEIYEQHNIAKKCLYMVELPPADAKGLVLARLVQWRSWDLNNLQGSFTMKAIYGSNPESAKKFSEHNVPTKVRFSTQSLRFLLDPGPKQNEISLYDLNAIAETNLIGQDQSANTASPSHLTIAQLSCPEISINLNWELFELADNLLRLYAENESQTKRIKAANLSSQPETNSIPTHDFHVTIATGKASVTVETINLTLLMTSQGLKGSLIAHRSESETAPIITSLILAAEFTTTTLSSHLQQIILYELL